MSLGEIPERTSMRGYWHLEDENDSSGNGRNLTNINVAFNQGKFNVGADFGTTGTKGLSRATNIFSDVRVANITTSFWFKLNDTTAHSGASSRLFTWDTVSSGTTGMRTAVAYTIAAGVQTIFVNTFFSTTNVLLTFTPSINSNYNFFTYTKTSTNTIDVYWNGVRVTGGTGAGNDVSSGSIITNLFVIGAAINVSANTSARGIFDEFIVEERAWSDSEIKKYYTQAKGRFCI